MSHNIRSFGLTSWRSSPFWGAPMRSFHFNLFTGVAEPLSVSGEVTSEANVFSSLSLPDDESLTSFLALPAARGGARGGARKLKAFNLFLVTSETGSSGLAGLLRAVAEWSIFE